MSENLLERIGSISAERQELLALLLKEEGVELEQTIIVPKRRETNVYPMSYAQERLWFLDQLVPDSPQYNIPLAVRLKGRLHIPVMEKAINEIIHRHEVLRTTFTAVDGEPRQVIGQEKQISVNLVDKRQESETAVTKYIYREAQIPFDLEQGPLLRVSLLQLDSEDHILLFTMHHIISDGWSMGILIQEFTEIYNACLNGTPSPLSPLPIQYADFSSWQREQLQGQELKTQLDYWINRLAGLPPLLHLPTDRPRPAVKTSRGASVHFSLPKQLSDSLNTLSQREGNTLFMTLMAAFQTLLFRYSGQTDICVGTPMANRNRSEIERLIGFFVNTIVIPADFSGNPTFKQILDQVRETTLGAYENQDVPFEMLVDALHPERNMSHSPLFQVMFVLGNTPLELPALPGLTLEPLDSETGIANFDLTLAMEEGVDGLRGSLRYNADLFDETSIQRLIGHYQTMLSAIVESPNQYVAKLPLLTTLERRLMLETWNETQLPYTLHQPIHKLIEKQAQLTPENTAVFHEGNQLTYAQLNRRANQLAHHLQKKGVKRDTIVGLYVERSLELIVGILGILKAGGAYLPLDWTYPSERLAYMLEDAEVSILLTQERLVSNLDRQIRKLGDLNANTDFLQSIICLDAEWPDIEQESAETPIANVTADNLAYIIYTSGSTGKPKGTMLAHRGLCNLAQDYVEQLSLNGDSRVLQFFSPGFDGSVGDIFSSLISGAAIYLPQRETLLSPSDLHQYIQVNEITHILMTPSMLAVLPTDDLPNLKAVLAGGEQFTKEIAFRWLPNRHIVNAYGPTETTVVSVRYTFDECSEVPENAAAIPIGRPTANTQLFILDQEQQPVPIGVPGELYIGGVGLARGYLHRPHLTAERFIPNPFWAKSAEYKTSSQLYRTGDLCRYLPDGHIEFLGRIDHQVKVRGFRIELGEIETILQRHPELETAVVIVREDDPGNKQLVAYTIARNETPPNAESLRAYLQEHLPGYMIPSAFVPLAALPRLPNGKVDRNALPVPKKTRTEMGGKYVAPRNPNEEMLAGIWASVLKTPQIGIYDNFFELGGHSLMATQLLSRLRNAFQVELPLQDLFAYPTIAELAARITEAQSVDSGAVPPILEPVSRDQDLPLSYGQQRLWFLNQLDPESPEYNVPDAVRLNGRLQIEVLEQCLRAIISRHETLRTTFVMVDGQPRQKIAEDLPVTIPITDLRHLPFEEREPEAMRLAIVEAQRPFDLSQGPLLRFTLYQLDDEDHIALLAMHHIVSDGWSMGVLIRELAFIYTAVVKGNPASLPELPIQYADFAHWQRHQLQLDAQMEYWQEQLSGSPPLLELPTDYPRPAVQTAKGKIQSFTLPQTMTNALKSLSQETGSTLFMALLAAFQTVLYRYSGKTDISVGTPIANRTREEIEDLIGFFVNTLVMRTDLSGSPNFRELLSRVRRVTLDAYANQDLPFDKLVDALKPERNLSHTPLFQVMFALQNAPLRFIDLPDLTIWPINIETGIANFDLTLIMEETAAGLTGAFEYNTDLFKDETISRLIGHFRTMLSAIIANPDELIANLPLLTKTERENTLDYWNDTAKPLPEYPIIHRLFEDQVARTPEAIAAIRDQEQLTYAELNRKANQLAHHLQKSGVTPETTVGIAVDRSFNLLVGLLGILKAGGSYLPLDSSYPPERLAFMIEDARPSVLLTIEALRPTFDGIIEQTNSTMPPQIIHLDSDWSFIAREADDDPRLKVAAENIAYLIYTSGSTGQPKGVQIPHRAVVNHNLAVVDLFALKPEDRVWQFATINFDTAVEEIFPTLLTGATLVLRDQFVPPVSDLCQIITSQQLSVLDLPTAYWHEWVLELDRTREALPDCLRLVVVGGEKVSAERFKLWQTLVGDTAVSWLNTYGPTETTVISTAFRPDDNFDYELPIGRPIANTQVYVLAENLEPVPVGVPGELCIGGLGVARGYRNRPDLTAERFIPNPFDDGNGLWSSPQLYKTGDLVRYRSDGHLEFLGRVDAQVKIRGFRVELGEIEAQLDQYAPLREAAVVLREDAPGQKRLVAYVVPAETDGFVVNDLRDFLEETLPAYMIPSLFVTLDALPLLPNGKVDRRSLPTPDQSRPALASALVAPHTPNELTLSAIWQEVLGLNQVGIHDNFFELGGDSILSIQVIARANQTGLRLTPRQFFEGPTVAQLASTAETENVIEAEQGVLEGSLPLTPIQRWYFDQQLPEPHHWNQAVLLESRQRLQPEILETAVSHLIKHHDALRLRFSESDAGWQQRYVGADEDIPFTWMDFSELSPTEQETAVTAESTKLQASLNLIDGPLLRIAYFDLGENMSGRLLMVIHHLAVDGISWRILLEDLQTIYRQLELAAPVSLPPKTTSYRAWAGMLEAYVQSEKVRQESRHWLSLAQLAPPALPRDFPGGLNTEASSNNLLVSLTKEETEALLRDVPPVYRTEINDVLLAALAQTMWQWTGSSTLVVDLEGHGRSDLFAEADLSRTVGWFTAVFPVALNLGGVSEPGESLKTVKEQLRLVPEKGIGYGVLRYLSQDKDIVHQLAAAPQAEISFNYLGQFDQVLPENPLFTPAQESRGSDRSLRGHRAHLIDVTGSIVSGKLQMVWTYCQDIHQDETIGWVAQKYIETLQAIIQHCQSSHIASATPSDFPLANLNQKKLDKLLAKMNR